MTKPVDNGNFFQLTPERVLEAVEASGLMCTGRCLTLNSFENRVYDVELEGEEEKPLSQSLTANRRIVKFYRPGRWTREQILEEHEFLFDLQEDEIPAIGPLRFPDGKTLQWMEQSGTWYAMFPKVGGRAPEEMTDEQLVRVGRLLGRIHNVGATKISQHRMRLDPQTYGIANLEFLIRGNWIPDEYLTRFETTVRKICEIVQPWFETAHYQRIHGDCHLNNLLWNNSGPFFLDFDDMVIGPEVQDIWLLTPGRDAESHRQKQVFLQGYQEFRRFDPVCLRLIEPLRALRFVHYAAWIAKRWEDPAFKIAFSHFNTNHYWGNEVKDLEEQLDLIQSI